jgi:hypothetical protein
MTDPEIYTHQNKLLFYTFVILHLHLASFSTEHLFIIDYKHNRNLKNLIKKKNGDNFNFY